MLFCCSQLAVVSPAFHELDYAGLISMTKRTQGKADPSAVREIMIARISAVEDA